MEQIPLALAPAPAPSFENYYPGPNRAAVAALRAACEGGGERFLFLWGPAGSGKSHLLRAVANPAARPPAGCAEPADGCGPACYVNAPHPLAEAGAGWPPALLAVDDCQRLDIVGQLALFDHYNAMRAGGGVLIAAGDRPPADMPVREDLRTRLGSGLVLRLQALDDAQKAEALTEHARSLGFDLPAEVLEFVMRRVGRDMGTQIRVVDALDQLSLARKRPVTVALAREAVSYARGAPLFAPSPAPQPASSPD